MSDLNTKIKSLGDALTKLVEFVPETSDDLVKWYAQAQILKDTLLFGDGGLSQHAPYFLWHYLSDADIRMKDREYAEMQKLHIDTMLQHLRRGIMPSDEDL